MARQKPTNEASVTAVPKITPQAARYYRERVPNFKYLDERLRKKDPILAEFILERAGQLSPGAENLKDREQIARLALEIYDLLLYQGEVNYLTKAFGIKTSSGQKLTVSDDASSDPRPAV